MNKSGKLVFFLILMWSICTQSSDNNQSEHQMVRVASDDLFALYENHEPENRSCWAECFEKKCCECCTCTWPPSLCYTGEKCCWVECWEQHLKDWGKANNREGCMYKCGYAQGTCGTGTAFIVAREISQDCAPNIQCAPLPIEAGIILGIMAWIFIGVEGTSWKDCNWWKNLREETVPLSNVRATNEVISRHYARPYPTPVIPQPQEMDSKKSGAIDSRLGLVHDNVRPQEMQELETRRIPSAISHKQDNDY